MVMGRCKESWGDVTFVMKYASHQGGVNVLKRDVN